MTEPRRMTPSDIRALSNQVKADYQAAFAEALAVGAELDQYTDLKAESQAQQQAAEPRRTR